MSLPRAREARPPPPRRLTWARPPPAGLEGRARGRGPAEPRRARERAGGASFQGFLALPRSRPPRSRLGARRPCVRVGVRSGWGRCGSAGARAPARRRAPGVRPVPRAPWSRPCPQRGPAGPRRAIPEPPGGECGRRGQGEGWLAGSSGVDWFGAGRGRPPGRTDEAACSCGAT